MQEHNLKKEFKQILLDTFADFILFCKNNDLSYFAAFGTVLGAIRHGGFIPWDDDIDVYMPREDYDKFISLRELLPDSYEIVDLNQEGYYQDFAKFVNKKTTLVESEEIPFVCGIYVDIFPLDQWDESYTDFEKDNKIFKKSFLTYFKSIRIHTLKSLANAIKHKNLKLSLKILTNIIYYQFRRKSSLQTIRRCMDKFSSVKGNYWCRYSTFPPESIKYPKDWFGDGLEMPFEELKVLVPKEYDKYLRLKYGDYMKLPPEDKRNSGHSQFYVNLHKRMSFDEVIKRKRIHPEIIIE